jgi:hypothetical protein
MDPRAFLSDFLPHHENENEQVEKKEVGDETIEDEKVEHKEEFDKGMFAKIAVGRNQREMYDALVRSLTSPLFLVGLTTVPRLKPPPNSTRIISSNTPIAIERTHIKSPLMSPYTQTPVIRRFRRHLSVI